MRACSAALSANGSIICQTHSQYLARFKQGKLLIKREGEVTIIDPADLPEDVVFTCGRASRHREGVAVTSAVLVGWARVRPKPPGRPKPQAGETSSKQRRQLARGLDEQARIRRIMQEPPRS